MYRKDVGLFTAPRRGDVHRAAAALPQAAADRGWEVRPVRSTPDFARLVLTGPVESVLVDLAVDATPRVSPR